MSTTPKPSLQLWLPALAHFAPDHPLRHLLPRADRLADGTEGYLAGLAGYFDGVDATLPAAALTREFLAGDADGSTWLSADPAWVRPDINGIRLMACGQLQLDMAEAQALAAPLKPVFGDAGMQLEVSTPDRWHLRLPSGSPLPAFAAPEQAMGEDLALHLPQGADGKRWRVLLNDIQILLHQHPLNIERRARGQAPVNSLWLWGGGKLPGHLRTGLRAVVGDDLLLRAVSQRAGIVPQARTAEAIAGIAAGGLIDLQDLPPSEIESQWWPSLQPLFERQAVTLHFASAERWQRKPWHRWRVWRRAGR